MKKLMISVAATALLLGSAAAAPDGDEHHGHHGGGTSATDNSAHGDRGTHSGGGTHHTTTPTPAATPAVTPARTPATTPARTEANTRTDRSRERTNQINAAGRPMSTDQAERARANYGNAMQNGTVTHADRERSFNNMFNPGTRSNNRDAMDNRNADNRNDRDSRNRNADNRNMDRSHNRNRANIDMTQFRRNVRSEHRYRDGAYHGPRGYNYRRWSYGERLPSVYFARDYWLTNFLAFGLISPPDGYTWVRYGDDALLIDEYTGEIVQVRYDVFWS